MRKLVSLVWIPNTLTLGNLFFGFTSMLAALRGRFDLAALLIFGSMLLDLFDGRVARAIKRANPIGKDLDSFADLVSFGIAPGVLLYAAFLGQVPIYPVWSDPQSITNGVHLAVGALAFVFPLCAALRLAKFNTLEARDGFSGLPSPVAGGLVVFLLLFDRIPGFFLDGFLRDLNFAIPYQAVVPIFLGIALLMVSVIRFSKPTKLLFSFRRRQPWWVWAGQAGVIALLVFFLKFTLLVTLLVYVAWNVGAATGRVLGWGRPLASPVARKPVTAGKAAPARKTVPAGKAVPARKAAPVRKAATAAKATPKRKT